MTPLCELALKYNTDKCPQFKGNNCFPLPGHDYTTFYHNLFQGKSIKKVLEVGIYEGASLRMWAEYWPEAEIWGADCELGRLLNVGRIHSVLCDQGDRGSLIKLAGEVGGNFDLIIDDASHNADHQILTAGILVPLLAPGGIYIIEDIPPQNKDKVDAGVPWPHRIVEFDLNRKPDDRLLVIEQPLGCYRETKGAFRRWFKWYV